MNKTLELRAQSAPWNSGVQIVISDQDGFPAVKIEYGTLDDGVEQPVPLSIGRTEAQVLMDDLWHCGYRPTEGTGSAGSLMATEKHLADMRKIAFKQLDME